MRQLFRITFLLCTLIFISGCTMTSPQYQPDFSVTNDLKDADLQQVSVGDFSSAKESVDRISIRGSTMISIFGGSYSEYLEHALVEQLRQAAIYREGAPIVITGTLLNNDFDGSGVSIGEANIAANFVVVKDGKQVYSKDHSIHHEWTSSFLGAVAIPNAQKNYPIAVQKLITEFLTDPEFISLAKS